MIWKRFALSCALLLLPAVASAIAIGDAIPAKDAPLTNVDDSKVTLGGASGAKGTLVVFTCNHCPYVKAWEDRIVALGNEYAKKGVGVVAVNSNDPKVVPGDSLDGMKARAKQKGFEFPYVVDETSEVAKAFGATKTPEVYLFDAAGKLAYHGAVDDSAEKDKVKATFLKDALDAVIAGNAPSPAETKALGCSIKFR